MAIVIERKFLVKNPPIDGATSTYIRQGFLSSDTTSVARVRVCEGGKCTLTIQGATENNAKQEFGFCISSDDALQMLQNLCQQEQIEKTRHFIPYEGDASLNWEVDVFHGDSEGLVFAEIKPKSADQEIILPDWITEEVSGQTQYLNCNLIHHPYKDWVLEDDESST